MTSSNLSSARISVPASSANLGPGVDCLAMALGLRLTAKADWDGTKVKLREFDSPLDWWKKCVLPHCKYTGTVATLEDDEGRPNLVAVAFAKAVMAGGPEYYLPEKLAIEMHSDIPVGQGLGSSAAAAVAGAALAEIWRTGKLDKQKVFAAAVEIEGHADNVGNPHLNQKLSDERAAEVGKGLAARGVPEQRIKTSGFSSRRPVASNTTAEGRQLNRRVEVVLLDEKVENITRGEPAGAFASAWDQLKNLIDQGVVKTVEK